VLLRYYRLFEFSWFSSRVAIEIVFTAAVALQIEEKYNIFKISVVLFGNKR